MSTVPTQTPRKCALCGRIIGNSVTIFLGRPYCPLTGPDGNRAPKGLACADLAVSKYRETGRLP